MKWFFFPFFPVLKLGAIASSALCVVNFCCQSQDGLKAAFRSRIIVCFEAVLVGLAILM